MFVSDDPGQAQFELNCRNDASLCVSFQDTQSIYFLTVDALACVLDKPIGIEVFQHFVIFVHVPLIS
jgi:hypothetical protein